MNGGVCRVKLRFPENQSLKGKRQVLNSIITRLRNKYNVSVAEVADNDLWQVATLGIAVVSNDERFSNEALSRIINSINAGRFDVEILDYEIELLPVS